MTALFNVPFLPDERYVRFLAEHIESLAAVHFPLLPASPLDARHSAGSWETDELKRLLAELKGPRRYALLNTRLAPPRCYEDSEKLRQITAQLDDLLLAGLLDGVVIADFFLLQALSRYAPDTASALEAVPSVNCLLSSFDRIAAFLDIIDASRFRPPAKIPLAPALNRQPQLLEKTVSQCRQAYPNLKIELMVNEVCLFQCPFKLSHDAGIAVNCLGQSDWTFPPASGCFAELREHPARLFKSPFIRPEDLHHYRQKVDIFKICGRTLGPDFLFKTVNAYFNERHAGNLLDLFDAVDWMAREWYLDNELLPADFLQKLLACDKRCENCGFCEELLRRTGGPQPLHLRDLRDRVKK